MSDRGHGATIVGVGLAACAACCAGPILGVVAALGIGTAAGFVLFGVLTLAIGATVIAALVFRRRRAAKRCAAQAPQQVNIVFGRSHGAVRRG